ncbi:MAG: outer membrane lipoprotein-sorting protein [Halanaerobiaceae bacterium]
MERWVKGILIILLTGLLILTFVPVTFALTAEEIMDRRDENEYLGSAYMEAEMIIEGRRRQEKSLLSYSQGDRALIEFTSPRDRGTKYLKRGDDLWMFFPDAEEEVHISGHMLRQDMMGSDFSYQDMMEEEKLTDLYEFELLEEDELDGRSVYVLRGTAREGEEPSYHERKLWIDSERFIGLREELYAANGRLLKISRTKKVQEFAGDRWYPVEMVMEDQLKEDTRTVFRITELEFDVEIPEGTFSRDGLR